MPKLTGVINNNGALVDVRLTPLLRWGAPVEGKGIIDTGAQMSNIGNYAIKAGRFRPTNTPIKHISTNGITKAAVYQGNVQLLGIPGHKVSLDLVESTQLEVLSQLAGVRIICLVGRDILNHAVLTYDGLNRTFTLELP
jgi:hypothetical protein